MPNWITDIELSAIEAICMRMRKCDREEIFAMRPYDNPLRLAMDSFTAIRNLGRGAIAWKDTRPVALAAFTEEWPGVWTVWMYGTDEFRDGAVPLLRWFRKTANDVLTVCEGRRLHCDSIATHHEAHKMIRAMGGIEECRLRKYGKGGQDFIRFVWFNGENDAVLRSGYVRAG